jgi:GT2 family glycosyltransferase
MSSTSVSVVIPTWNRRELLKTLLEQLALQTLQPAEVVVVDDGGEDDSAELAGRMGATVVRMEQNAGFAQAVNRGVAMCKSELVVILNNDVEPETDWLQKMTAGLGDAWFASGKLLDSTNRSRIDGAFDELARSGCACRCGHGMEDGPFWNEGRKIRMAPFTAALFRKELFERVGPLDETFESYLEDIDFGIRCARFGFAGVYVPEAVAFHRGSATLGRWHGETVRRMARNQVFLIAKHYPRGWWRRHGWHVLVGQSMWGAAAFRHAGLGAWIRGKWEGIRDYGKVAKAVPGGAPDMDRILREGDAFIAQLHRQFGWTRYWRLYFALTGYGADR